MKKIHMDRFNVNQIQILIITAFLLILVGYLGGSNDRFFSVLNLSNLIRQAAFTIIVGCGATFLVIEGNIDVSVGSVLATTCVVYALVCKETGTVLLAICACMGVGLLAGIINGIVSVYIGIPAIITTMGTMNIFRGLAFIICQAKSITSEGLFPDNYSFLGRGTIFQVIPIPLIIVIIVIAISLLLEKKTVFGKYSLSIGGNKTAAILAGINIKKIQMLAFLLTGVLAGLAGALMSSRVGIGEPKTGYDFEFDVMIAVILGGTSMKGGEGKVIGTVIGAVIVAVLDNGLDLLGISSFYQYVVKGVVLVFSVVMTEMLKYKFNLRQSAIQA